MSNSRALRRRIAKGLHRAPLQIGPSAASLVGYPGPGEINTYTCDECHGQTVVVHQDTGVTPMFLGCRATLGCRGRGVSAGYRVEREGLKPRWVWYRPDEQEYLRLNAGAREHIDQGGLVLRPITPEESS